MNTNTKKAAVAIKPAKAQSESKKSGKVAARNYFHQLLPIDSKMERHPLMEAGKFRFTKEEAQKLADKARASGKFTHVQTGWKAKNGYSVFASVRPAEEVVKARVAAGTLTIKPKAEKAQAAKA